MVDAFMWFALQPDTERPQAVEAYMEISQAELNEIYKSKQSDGVNR
jgi:hypothetical protein